MTKRLLAAFVAAFIVGTAMAPASAQMKPLSPADKARVDTLLKNFDPNSYDIRYQYSDRAGGVKMAHAGRAVGLSSLRQSNTKMAGGARNASTVNTINVFRTASTVNTINVFKNAASTVNTINVFANRQQAAAAKELNSILARYYSGP